MAAMWKVAKVVVTGPEVSTILFMLVTSNCEIALAGFKLASRLGGQGDARHCRRKHITGAERSEMGRVVGTPDMFSDLDDFAQTH